MRPARAVLSRWRLHRGLIGWVVTLAVAVAAAGLIHAFVLESFSIPSGSIEPTLDIHDRIVVDRLSYDLHGVHRGDMVVFHEPADDNCGGPPTPYLVKRVIGLPGEQISSSGGVVLINGKPLQERWLPKVDPLGRPISTTTIPAGHYYVLGDDRSDSCDSRYWGPLDGSLIVGRVVLRFWPLSRLDWF